ncbi:MAG: extracellular solute-binding protein [Clostridia bacterium]|nr:extracellular solute-binding protein [Clostridia bacterium]
MYKNYRLRLTALAMAALMLVGIAAPTTVSADENDVPNTDIVTESGNGSYNRYTSDNKGYSPAEKNISLGADKAKLDKDITLKEVSGKNALVWNEGTGKAEWSFEVEKDAYYNIKLIYTSVSTGVDYTFGIMLDGKSPFEEAAALSFPRLWENAEDKFKTDNLGNQLSPEQKEVDTYCEMFAKSLTGVTVDPFAFYLTKGSHTLTLVGPGQAVAVASVVLAAPEKLLSYNELSKDYDKNAVTDAKTIVIEGESAKIKTSSKLIPKADNSDAGMSPLDVMYTKLNYIGGTSWQEAGQTLEWSFKVEKAGYYALGVRYRQSDVINAESWRWLKIDGKTPFEEAKGIRFPYCASWDFFEFGDGTQPYYFWLDEGEHTVSMEVTLGAMADYYYRLSEIVEILGNKYIEIVKITGATPDINLDYELFNQIPDLNEKFEYCHKKLEGLANDLKGFTGKRSSQYIAAMNNMSRVLKVMVKNPYLAHQYVSDYYTNYSSLSSWLNDMKNMPLYVDTIQFAPVGKNFVNKNPSFLKTAWFTVKKLFVSFIDDYIIESKFNENDVESLTLWVNWGRDQATALDTLIRDSFTEEYGIPVNVRITNASLVNGLLAGNFPDMSLHLTRTEPVNLGIRGALVDLNEMPDIDEVLTRFQESAEVPYTYNGKLYALPDTQNFQMMFYRTDILESLGLEVPKTWDEFLYTAAIIQRNNMNVYIPYTQITAATTVSAGIGALNLFPTLMSQNGLSLYNDKLNATALSSVEATAVFDLWTDLYTDYDFQKEADFYNRFRVGTMPLGIAPYSTYITLYSAAPEIKGRWAVACVPGMEGGNNSVAGAGTGCSIIKKSPNRENAWKFLKWWTSADTQIRYSSNVESLIGMLGRQQTANVEALNGLAWDKKDLAVINEQWSRVNEVPEVPGSYYFSRALDQAFWSVINDGTNAKDAISKWSKVADAEIQRKIKEYS